LTAPRGAVTGTAKAEDKLKAERRVWDLPVRIFHWGLASAFLAAS